jgi:hypothetical protein
MGELTLGEQLALVECCSSLPLMEVQPAVSHPCPVQQWRDKRGGTRWDEMALIGNESGGRRHIPHSRRNGNRKAKCNTQQRSVRFSDQQRISRSGYKTHPAASLERSAGVCVGV